MLYISCATNLLFYGWTSYGMSIRSVVHSFSDNFAWYKYNMIVKLVKRKEKYSTTKAQSLTKRFNVEKEDIVGPKTG